MKLHLYATDAGWCGRNAIVEPEDLVRIAIQAGEKDDDPEECEKREISRRVFGKYFPDAHENQRPGKIYIEKIGDQWLVISWCDRKPDKPTTAGMVFAHREHRSASYHYFPLPNDYVVDPENGTITTRRRNEHFIFPARIGAWPDQLIGLEKYAAIDILDELLTPTNKFPEQFRKRLTEIKELLTSSR